MRARQVAVAGIAVLAVITGACSRQQQERSTPAPSAQEPAPQTSSGESIVLPDVSSLEAPVQRQIRDAYSRLGEKLKSTTTPPADLAAAYGDLGRLLMAVRFDDQAVSCYLHAEAAAPADRRWPYYLGHAYLRKGDREHAASSFARASRLAPADVVPLVWLGATNLDDGRLDQAQAAFTRALMLQPKSTPALFGAGRTALAAGKYAQAVDYLERALAIDTRASAIHYPLATAYRRLGDAQKADAHLQQRGDATPELDDPLMQSDDDVLNSTVGFEHRGMQALKRADWPAAIGQFRKGLELSPDDVTLRYWLGAALYASGDADAAEKEFRAVVQRSPRDARAHFSLGAIDDGKGLRREAIEEYSAAVKADPTLPDANLRLADALRRAGQLQTSFAQYERAVESDPRLADAWVGGADVLIELSQYDDARRWLSRARRVYPDRKELVDLEARLPP